MIEITEEMAREILSLLYEADYWVDETQPSEWQLFSRIYDTRGAFKAASKKSQKQLEKAMTAVGIQQ